jgi:hypothetical protein
VRTSRLLRTGRKTDAQPLLVEDLGGTFKSRRIAALVLVMVSGVCDIRILFTTTGAGARVDLRSIWNMNLPLIVLHRNMCAKLGAGIESFGTPCTCREFRLFLRAQGLDRRELAVVRVGPGPVGENPAHRLLGGPRDNPELLVSSHAPELFLAKLPMPVEEGFGVITQRTQSRGGDPSLFPWKGPENCRASTGHLPATKEYSLQ